MDFSEVVRRRRMVRTLSDRPVPAEKLDRIMDFARRGPSAGFSQGQSFLVLQGDDLASFTTMLETPRPGAVPDVATRPDVGDPMRAPVLVVPMSSKCAFLDRYAEPDKGWTDRAASNWPVPFWHIDTGMAVLLILQTAVAEGLGACYFGFPVEHLDAFRSRFGVPADQEPIGLVSIGYDAEEVRRDLRARRRPLADVVHYGRWGGAKAADAGMTSGDGSE